MKRSEIFSGGFLKAEHLEDKSIPYGYKTAVLTIASIRTGELPDGGDQRCISFEEEDKELGLNGTNWDSIAAITGRDDDEEWIGSQIELFVDKAVKFKGKIVHAIRIRAPRSAAPATTKPVASKPSPAPAGGPPPDDDAGAAPAPAGGWDKTKAWARWGKHHNGNPPIDQWRAAIAKVTESSGGLQPGQFTATEWGEVAAAAVPF